ncbi:MAG TPA: hypothetical protein IAB14_03620 [Candidatus Stercoripulliclostridium merdipullorum]|uniref:Transcriptional coactivator p15 (PC4) C-terminal domain-containing protein n=1 Tax=Candidatus Stercoripulliclostridium merdipullorum TaxID=2840952 RepID=A0A9D1SX08_9FIRM|nr:hypothetical protein [Candidatus Stercoripulliclostridium merdipullorum]
MPELKYEITQKVGVLSESNRGWTKELNYVSWNEREARLDLREWSPNHDRMGKGVTLSKEEAVKLKELLNSIEL